ncbi:patatin-like phospholipase, putative [Plasmodium chabaudi chabaudi]|uniref:Patatin-like phospholipase, putative n=1 Tax=Plasmodium chabaudi chabaudi TaxID=31271 RepID=A0A4V0K3N9_PLACU|nr:patatin-like phospholipase, putative [Plasmodium chabaudi chabaudi]VTZ67092.1 patatin-like phospholipase, putative [Plasmodium chabaudi chabaudi]|eukprot:XP_741267.2 conserved Plasmodium protein, unknown function [Plasmodium chabaudi chabaudi]
MGNSSVKESLREEENMEELNKTNKIDKDEKKSSNVFLEDNIISMYIDESSFTDLFKLQDISKYIFSAGKEEDIKEIKIETSPEISDQRTIEDIINSNNKYIIDFVNGQTKDSKIEIANFISFYDFFLSTQEEVINSSVESEGQTDEKNGMKIDEKNITDQRCIYKQIRESINYISTENEQICIRNYLNHFDSMMFPINLIISKMKNEEVPITDEFENDNDVVNKKNQSKYEKGKLYYLIEENVKNMLFDERRRKSHNMYTKKMLKHRNSEIDINKNMNYEQKGVNTIGEKFTKMKKEKRVTICMSNHKLGVKKVDESFLNKNMNYEQKGVNTIGEKFTKMKKEKRVTISLSNHKVGVKKVDESLLNKNMEVENTSNELESENKMSFYTYYIKRGLPRIFNKRKSHVNNIKEGKEDKKKKNLGISFSPAGLLIPYHLGVSSVLVEKNIMNVNTNLGGSSAGSICACCLGLGINVYKCLFLAENIIKNAHINGCYKKLESLLSMELNKYIYKDSYKYLNDRLGNVFVGITQILPYYKRLNINNFYDDSDLKDAIVASCNIPMYISNNVFANFRNKKCIDGFFSTKRKDFGCPNTKTERIIKVSPFDAEYLGIENKNNSVISPQLNKYNHIIFLFISIKNLFNKFINNILIEEEYLFLIQNLRKVMNEKVFDYTNFMKQYFFPISHFSKRFKNKSDSTLQKKNKYDKDEIIMNIQERLGNHLSNSSNENSVKINLFVKTYEEINVNLYKHNYDVSCLYKFCVILINITNKYFMETFNNAYLVSVLTRIKMEKYGGEIDINSSSSDSSGSSGSSSSTDSSDGSVNNLEIRIEEIFDYMKSHNYLDPNKFIILFPHLINHVILFFFKESFCNENILRDHRRYLKSKILNMIDMLKNMFLIEFVKKGIKKYVLSHGFENDYKNEFNLGISQKIIHFLKYRHIYKNFICITNEIKNSNSKILKINEYNYYNFININKEDIGDYYIFMYIYLYAIIFYKSAFLLSNEEKAIFEESSIYFSTPSQISELSRIHNDIRQSNYTSIYSRNRNSINSYSLLNNNLKKENVGALKLATKNFESWVSLKLQKNSDPDVEPIFDGSNLVEKYKRNSIRRESSLISDNFLNRIKKRDTNENNKLEDQKHEDNLFKVNNFLIFNNNYARVNNLEEYIYLNKKNILEINIKNKNEIISNIYSIYVCYCDVISLLKFVLNINFCEKTKYRYLKKTKGLKKKIEQMARDKKMKQKNVNHTSINKFNSDSNIAWADIDSQFFDENINNNNNVDTTKEMNNPSFSNSFSNRTTTFEDWLVQDSYEIENSIFTEKREDEEDQEFYKNKKDGKMSESEKVKDNSEYLLQGRKNKMTSSYSDTEYKKKKKKKIDNKKHETNMDNFLKDFKTNINPELFDTYNTYFIKNKFPIRKLIRMLLEGTNDKNIKKLYDMGRSDTYMWLYLEYINMSIYLFKKVYSIYLNMIYNFQSLLYLTNMDLKKKKYEVSNILNSVENVILYVNGVEFNLFSLCRYISFFLNSTGIFGVNFASFLNRQYKNVCVRNDKKASLSRRLSCKLLGTKKLVRFDETNELVGKKNGEKLIKSEKWNKNIGDRNYNYYEQKMMKKKKKKEKRQKGKIAYRSISLPTNLTKTVIKISNLRNKINLNKNIIEGINNNFLKNTPYEHIYSHTNFWLYSSSEDSDDEHKKNMNELWMSNNKNPNIQFDDIFDEISEEMDSFSVISNFFKPFKNMDSNNLNISGYFGF